MMCQERCDDGSSCTFTGRPAEVGLHKYYVHGMCNPIKAITLTNVCPGCGEMFKTLRSTREHTQRSLKNGRCATKKIARPYLFENEPLEYDDVVGCRLRGEHVEGR